MRTMFDAHLSGYPPIIRSGAKDYYSTGNDESLLLVYSDRMSIKERPLLSPVPERGIALAQLSNFWHMKTGHIVSNDLADPDPSGLNWFYEDDWYYGEIKGRVSLLRKAHPPIQKAMVRGYMTPSACKEYNERGTVLGTPLSRGLQLSEKTPKPLFSFVGNEKSGTAFPAHPEPLEAVSGIDPDLCRTIEKISVDLYTFAEQYAIKRGIIIAETLFTFGFIDGKIAAIDELLTFDSSVFWSLETHRVGQAQIRMDRRPIVDYLKMNNWNETKPLPRIPQDILNNSAAISREILASMLEEKAQTRELSATGPH